MCNCDVIWIIFSVVKYLSFLTCQTFKAKLHRWSCSVSLLFSRNWLCHVNFRPCCWLCAGRTIANPVHWCWFETQARRYLFFFYLDLYYFNHVSTTGRAFLYYFFRITWGIFLEKKQYTQFLCSILAALLHELMPHHHLV